MSVGRGDGVMSGVLGGVVRSMPEGSTTLLGVCEGSRDK